MGVRAVRSTALVDTHFKSNEGLKCKVSHCFVLLLHILVCLLWFGLSRENECPMTERRQNFCLSSFTAS